MDRAGGTSVSCGQTGLFSYFYGLFGSAPSGAITLTDCLLQFYESEELSGGDKYKCEHCKQHHDSTKQLSLVQLPEVMTVHIKRFKFDNYFGNSMGTKLSDIVEFPMEDLDVRQFTKAVDKYKNEQSVTTYDLFALVEHRGSLNGGHYVGYVNQEDTWFEFDDTHVKKVTAEYVSKLEAYILFYRLRCPPARKKEREEVFKAIEKGAAEAQVFISKLWFHRWANCVNPGPIDMTGFTCHHGNVQVPASDAAKLKSIPSAVWDTLQAKWKGGPKISALSECHRCLEERAELVKRRQHEQKLVHDNDRTFIDSGQCWSGCPCTLSCIRAVPTSIDEESG